MLSTAVAAWRNLVKRLYVDWLILTAATVTILLAMVLLAAGPIYADAVTQSALRRTLTAAPLSDSTVVAEVRTPPSEYEMVDGIATTAVTNAFPGMETSITRIIDAEPLELPDRGDDDIVDLAQVRSVAGIAEHASLVEGAWPGPGLHTAVSQSAAAQLDLGLGDVIELTDRRNSQREVALEVAAIYQPDVTDRFWLEEELVLAGVVESGGFRTYGPFVVDEADLSVITSRATATWRAHPDFDTLEVGEASRIRGGVAALPSTLNEALATNDRATSRFSEFTVSTELDRLLAGTGRSLTVTRSSVLALLIQLAILAGYALALTAGLLAETRRSETSLLSARGASPRQLVGVAGLEGVLLTIPAALAAPPLAAWTLEALVSRGPLAPIGLDVAPTVTAESRLIVFVAALAAIVALAWPAWRSARSISGSGRRSRQRARSGAQRAGVDIALVGLALIAFWQLQSLGPRVASTFQGRFGLDPVLIAAPTLGLLAGSVLALRVVPLLARVAERIAASGRGSVPALSSWQVARRPLRYARSALLLIMAVAIGFFAASYSSTWIDSQRDQADFQIGADLRLQPNRRTGDSVTDLHLVRAHESVPGVARSMTVTRRDGALPGADSRVEFLLLDSSAAGEVVVMRQDLAPGFDGVMARLAEARPILPGVSVPGDPERLGVVVSIVEEEAEHTGEPLGPAFDADIRLVFQDDDGLLHRLPLGRVSGDETERILGAPVVTELDDGSIAIPAHPLTVVAVEIASRYPNDAPRMVTLDLVGLVADQGDSSWEPVPFDTDPDAWMTELESIGPIGLPPSIAEAEVQPDGALRLEIETGIGFGGLAFFGIRSQFSPPPTYPVVVSEDWLAATNRQVGEVMVLEALATGRSRAEIAGTVGAFPASNGDVVLVDLPTYQVLRYAPGTPIAEVGEHWLAVSGDTGPVEQALLAPPLDSIDVADRTDRFAELSTDPVALGTIGALSIGFLAAGVFAAVGFAVSATVSARERMTEFGLLRALGLSPRQLGGWMALEQGALVVSSLVFGTLVGWALTRFVLPLISVTQQGTRPVPEVVVIYPWQVVVLLEAGLVAVLGVIVVVMTLLLRRRGLGSLLRLGED